MIAKAHKLKGSPLTQKAKEEFLLHASELFFFNTSPMDLDKMGQNDIKNNLNNYIQSFSTDAREIFEELKYNKIVLAP